MAVTINRVVNATWDGTKYLNEAEYKGLSTDDKPTDCMPNSLFLELNTGDVYYYTGEAWSKIGA